MLEGHTVVADKLHGFYCFFRYILEFVPPSIAQHTVSLETLWLCVASFAQIIFVWLIIRGRIIVVDNTEIILILVAVCAVRVSSLCLFSFHFLSDLFLCFSFLFLHPSLIGFYPGLLFFFFLLCLLFLFSSLAIFLCSLASSAFSFSSCFFFK